MRCICTNKKLTAYFKNLVHILQNYLKFLFFFLSKFCLCRRESTRPDKNIFIKNNLFFIFLEIRVQEVGLRAMFHALLKVLEHLLIKLKQMVLILKLNTTSMNKNLINNLKVVQFFSIFVRMLFDISFKVVYSDREPSFFCFAYYST